MRHLDLFSGIGGFALAARNVGWQTLQFVEIEPYCQKVLAKNFPGVPVHDDIKTFRPEHGSADIITAGWPCQDISNMGTRLGLEGKRSGLWYETARVIGDVGPRYVVLENVSALLGRGMADVLGDLAEIGYDCEWHCIPAAAVGAPHRRDRVWIIAYPSVRAGHDEETRAQRADTHGLGPHRTQVHLDGETELRHQQDRESGPLCETVPDANGTDLRLKPGRQESRPQASQPAESGEKRHAGPAGRDPGCQLLEGWQPKGPDNRSDLWRHAEWWATEPLVGQLVDGLPAQLAGLRGLTDDQRWIQIPCEKTAEECLRDLRKHKNSLRASHRPELEEQRTIEFDDAVQLLSHIIASCSGRDNAEERETALQALRENVLSSGNVQHASDEVQAVWQSIDDTTADWFILATCLGRDWADRPIGRIANGVPNRVDRLRALGNGIVPQVAQCLFEAIARGE